MIGVLIFILGLVLGSFFNVCIYRIPRDESIVFPPSHCPECGEKLHAVDLIPVVSFLCLRGKCRYCKSSINWQYPLIELLTGGLFLLTYEYKGLTSEFFASLIFISLLIIVCGIDFYCKLIPNILVIPGICLTAFFRYLTGFGLHFLAGLSVGAGVLLLIYLVSRGGMGEGDIFLSGMIGGFLGFPLVVVALLTAFISGGILGAILLLTKQRKRKDAIPFGPFLAIGGLTALWWGTAICHWYFSFLE